MSMVKQIDCGGNSESGGAVLWVSAKNGSPNINANAKQPMAAAKASTNHLGNIVIYLRMHSSYLPAISWLSF